ncbi:recombinase family protein [Nonomuraea sp. NPDC059023]|uniref:recombinase family protein n=1 Tax=unclassified Nonomuraea TaxID=2593643 RepID=UPI00369645AA
MNEIVIDNDDPHAREDLIGLARVSTNAQELAQQIDALTAAGCAKIFLDKGSGKKRTHRPGLAAALGHMRRGDTLIVLDLTRLGRDTRQLLAIVEDHLHARGRRFRTLDGIVLDTRILLAAGKAQTSVAKKLGVSRWTLRRAVYSNSSWRCNAPAERGPLQPGHHQVRPPSMVDPADTASNAAVPWTQASSLSPSSVSAKRRPGVGSTPKRSA